MLGAVLLGVLLALPCAAQERLAFIGVALDLETRQADRKLQDLLARRAQVAFAPEELEYEAVIKRLTRAGGDAPFLARATPYVCVASEMLGADLEVLGTYASATTQRTTYRSYFVVSRKAFPSPPDLPSLYAHLRTKRARFVYHSPFSTSSFFLPSLYFRAQKLFHMPENTESLWAMDCVRVPGNSSSRLVELVASGEADLAAVWDGTRAKLASTAAGAAVHFIPMPAELPNDLLVCSRSLDARTKDALRAALRELGPDGIATGDFRTWGIFEDQAEARKALAELRWQAREAAAPVTVEIRMRKGREGHAGAPALLESVRQSVRLSATELVPYDRDFHEHVDYAWTLEPVHDGALVLRSAVPGFEEAEQVFRISFRSHDDLTRRIIALVHARLHRIRSVWPYSGQPPIIIRDTAYAVPEGHVVKVQRITWLDPERDKFRAGPVFKARIDRSDYYRYELNGDDLRAGGGDSAILNPLGNESLRVLLAMPPRERWLFRGLTLAMVALLAAAAVASAWALWRNAPAPPPSADGSGG
jgi:ABC-type phosphate/phosphonate transport system substrate-binding protein